LVQTGPLEPIVVELAVATDEAEESTSSHADGGKSEDVTGDLEQH